MQQNREFIEKHVQRDSSKAVVSKDQVALEQYRKTKQKYQEIERLTKALNNLEQRVQQLEKLLGANIDPS